MATHSSILAWTVPIDRGACQATVWGRRELEKGYFVGFLLCAHLKVQFMASVLLRLRWISEWVSDGY